MTPVYHGRFFGRPFVKRLALCYQTDVFPVCSVCDVGVLWPNGWMDQDETWHAGTPSFRPMSVVATIAHLSYWWALVYTSCTIGNRKEYLFTWLLKGLMKLQLCHPAIFTHLIDYLRPYSITLSCSLAGRRPAGEPAGESANELDSEMEFDKFHYVFWLVSWSTTCFRLNSITLIMSQTWFPTCRRQVRAISTCRDSSNLVADWFMLYSITLYLAH